MNEKAFGCQCASRQLHRPRRLLVVGRQTARLLAPSLLLVIVNLALLLSPMLGNNQPALVEQLDHADQATDGNPAQEQSLQSWLGAHLQQADAWSTVASNQGVDAGIDEARRDLQRRMELQRVRTEQPMTSNSLLRGLPPATMERASDLAEDPSRLLGALSEGLDLDVLLALAALRSPSLKAAHHKLLAALGGLSQADYLQELLVRYRAFTRQLDTQVGSSLHRPGIKRHFPSPATLTLKSEIAEARVEMARLDYQNALRDALNSMAQVYFELRYIDDAGVVLLESRDLFERMEQVALAQLRVARASQSDALRSQALLDVLDADLENLREERLSVLAEGNALLDLPVGSEWRLEGSSDLRDPEISRQQAHETLELSNQQLLGKNQRLRMLDAALRLAEFSLYPLAASGASRLDLGRGAEAGPNRSKAAAFPDRPVLNQQPAAYGFQAAYLDELRLRLQAERDELEALKALLRAQAEESRLATSQAKRTQDTYQQLVVPKSLRAFTSMRGLYNTAGAAFIDYLDAGRAYLEASLEGERARRDHNQALARLAGRLGLSAVQFLGPAPDPEEQEQPGPDQAHP